MCYLRSKNVKPCFTACEGNFGILTFYFFLHATAYGLVSLKKCWTANNNKIFIFR